MTILLLRALSAQHLPPHARACTIRFGAMSRSTVSALHAAYFSSGSLTALGFFTSQAVHSLAFYIEQPTTSIPLQQLRQPSITSHPPSAARLAGCLLGRAGSLPQGVAHSVCRRRAGCLPGAVASQHAHPPAPLGRSCLLLPWPAPGHHAPTGGPPVRPPSCLCCQPVSHCLHILHRLVLHAVAFHVRA